MQKSQLFTWIGAIAILFLACVSCTPAKQETKPVELKIFSASSLKNAMLDIQKIYIQENPNITVTYDFSASGLLKEKIINGTSADIFLSASSEQMDELQSKGLILANSRSDFLSNRIVAIALRNFVGISDFKDLTSNKVKKVALGEIRTVPVGKYGQEVFMYLRIFEQLKAKLIFAPDAVQVVRFVEDKKAEAGIVFATDAILSDKIKIVAIAPESSHTPIIYCLGIIKNSGNIPESQKFIKFMQSEQAKAVYLKYRFAVK